MIGKLKENTFKIKHFAKMQPILSKPLNKRVIGKPGRPKTRPMRAARPVPIPTLSTPGNNNKSINKTENKGKKTLHFRQDHVIFLSNSNFGP